MKEEDETLESRLEEGNKNEEMKKELVNGGPLISNHGLEVAVMGFTGQRLPRQIVAQGPLIPGLVNIVTCIRGEVAAAVPSRGTPGGRHLQPTS
ncbi:hypothetical protein E2C01_047959 [Portunus trituberculatus]|uniref:Uncharacterized protein n=1 Tax=Portunus trituberculatus TaxID=210409 RepID=A0A5B7G502_PORTR|nr:hypothetical protein [Portunus trituberculatus]